MILLAIESSCDETAMAILESRLEDPSVSIIAEQISSQIKIHVNYGGVVPELAAREHMKTLPLMFKEMLDTSGLSIDQLDGYAVTQGPGLKGCLLMGICYARGLAYASEKPLFGVHHIEGHLLAPMLDNPDLVPPYLALVVSGGHTEIVQVSAIGDYKVLARTSDDAAGEAFDKSAHLMGFEYPGGPALAALADQYSSTPFKLPKVMREASGFSFSGLKTAISLLIKKNMSDLADQDLKGQLAFAIQESIVDALCFKLKLAAKETGIKKIAVTGGVAANKRLRQVVSDTFDRVYFPDPLHCTDNAAMIGYTALQRQMSKLNQPSGKDVFARWPIEQINSNA